MAMTVLQKIAANIAGKQFSIMVDETTDVSNTEQPVLCFRYVNEKSAMKISLPCTAWIPQQHRVLHTR